MGGMTDWHQMGQIRDSFLLLVSCYLSTGTFVEHFTNNVFKEQLIIEGFKMFIFLLFSDKLVHYGPNLTIPVISEK